MLRASKQQRAPLIKAGTWGQQHVVLRLMFCLVRGRNRDKIQTESPGPPAEYLTYPSPSAPWLFALLALFSVEAPRLLLHCMFCYTKCVSAQIYLSAVFYVCAAAVYLSVSMCCWPNLTWICVIAIVGPQNKMWSFTLKALQLCDACACPLFSISQKIQRLTICITRLERLWGPSLVHMWEHVFLAIVFC